MNSFKKLAIPSSYSHTYHYMYTYVENVQTKRARNDNGFHLTQFLYESVNFADNRAED